MEMSGRRGGKTMEAEKEIAGQIQFGKTAYKIGMDFANGKDTTAYLLKHGENKMALVSRYIALKEKSTGRYIGDLQGQLVTTLQNAHVFDMEDGDLRGLAKKMLTDEYTLEYLMPSSLPPPSFSFAELFGHLG